jgi:hypothetical protein
MIEPRKKMRTQHHDRWSLESIAGDTGDSMVRLVVLLIPAGMENSKRYELVLNGECAHAAMELFHDVDPDEAEIPMWLSDIVRGMEALADQVRYGFGPW